MWEGIKKEDFPELRAPDPDGHGHALDSSATIDLLRRAKGSKDPSEQAALRRLAKMTVRLWKPEELDNLRQRLLEDEELWDEIPGLLE